MAKAVTLKNNNDEEVYPVTDISLVNGELPTARIADGAITTPKIADGAVTSEKINWSTVAPYWYNATNGNAVTIPKDGVYYISAQTSTNDVVGGLYLYYQKSGTSTWTAVSASYNSQSGWHNWSVQKVIALGAGDKVKITWPSQDPMQKNGVYSQFNIVEVLGAS